MKEILIILIILPVLLLIVYSCRKKLPENARKLKEYLTELIPSGTGIADAEKTMKSYGFTCRYMTNADFIEESPGNSRGIILKNIDYLYCDQEKSEWPLIWISERWQVAIVQEKGKVKSIYVSYGLTGP